MIKKANSLLIFCALICSASLFASDEKTQKDPKENIRQEKIDKYELRADKHIGPKLFSGSYLIYDCQKKFYACVNDFSFEECTEKRAKSIADNKKIYACAPIKKFNSYLECSEYNLKIIDEGMTTRFCFPK